MIRLRNRSAQRGVAAVEFALVSLLFFVIVFAIIEFVRIMYMYNALADATRVAARAAANIDWRDTSALDKAKQHAIMRDSPGELPFGFPVTDKHIRIDYMYLRQQDGSTTYEPINAMPTCPGRNRHNCLTNPYGDGTNSSSVCVRIVRARICNPGTNCDPVDYQLLIPLFNFGVKLPVSTTITTAETLGYHAGDPVCP
jgi:hypothetical protein